MIAKRTLVIINPISGTQNKAFIERLIENHLPEDQFNFAIEYTVGPTHATDLAAAAAKDGFDLVIAVGGDGTINETATGLIGTDTALGIIPIGSGNGLGRHLQIPMNPSKAIKTFSESEVMKIDVCTANGRPFFNVAGVGYDALIAHKFAQMESRGFSAYIYSVLNQWFKYKPKKYKIKTEQGQFKKRALMISMANGSQFGNNAWIAPNARLDDGLIDVCMLTKFHTLAAPALAFQLFNKTIDDSKYLETFRSAHFTVKQKSKIAHLDGEPFKLGKKIEFKVLPKALNIFVPKAFLHELHSEYSLSQFE